MKGTLILLDDLNGREAAAKIKDGKLVDLLIDDPETTRPGAIFRAICDRPVKGMGGMMVKLPDGSGFLRHAKGLSPGTPILVQVSGFAGEGKAVPVTNRLLFKSRYAIVTPGAEGRNVSRTIKDEQERIRLRAIAEDTGVEGVILRSACEGAAEAEIRGDIIAMADLCDAIMSEADGRVPEALTEGDGPHALAWREWIEPAQVITEPGCFEHYDIEERAREAASGRYKLDTGWIAIEPTSAMVAVDVNTGGEMSPAAGLRANVAMAKALPGYLRLMGLGGQIVIDVAPMAKGQRKQIEQVLTSAIRADGTETNIAGWTPLGHLELQRKRDRQPLHAQLG